MKVRGLFNGITKAANELKEDGTPYPYHYDDCKESWSGHDYEFINKDRSICRKCGHVDYDTGGF